MMKYKSYTAKIEFDDEAMIFHGEVVGINAVITFQAKDADGLKTAFKDSVDDYLEWCLERGTEPDKPYSGNFPVRATPELHKQVVDAATAHGMGLNEWLNAQLKICANNALQDTNIVK